MKINGKISGITYRPQLTKKLETIELSAFDINEAPTTSVINTNGGLFAISKWVSPKRTRSYPYQRVYDTLDYSKKITVIPIIKDEGVAGDRDYLQWDTISLMSLLDVYVIVSYYCDAEISPRNNNKITNQKLDNEYIINKIGEIQHYHSSALHWNLKELKDNFHKILENAITSYQDIEKVLCVKMHSVRGIANFQKKIGVNIEKFMEFSRGKAMEAQKREIATIQPKESLSDATKAMITITNYLGGEYNFTVDQVFTSSKHIELIEAKHTVSSNLPSEGDIKDGLLKMILYSNLKGVVVGEFQFDSLAVLKLSSVQLSGAIDSKAERGVVVDFCQMNKLDLSYINSLFAEANLNNFIIQITQAE